MRDFSSRNLRNAQASCGFFDDFASPSTTAVMSALAVFPLGMVVNAQSMPWMRRT